MSGSTTRCGGCVRAGRRPRLTDSELLTLAVAQVLLGVRSEARWLRLVPAALPGSHWPAPTDAVQWGLGPFRMITTTSARPADRSVGVLVPAGWKEHARFCGLHRRFACFDCCNWPRRAGLHFARTP